MPKYQITAPDGRVVVIEGNRPPTSTDAQRIFAGMPTDPNRRKTAESGLDVDRELIKSEPGRAELEKRAEAGEPRARGNIGLLQDIATESSGPLLGQGIGALTGPAAPVAVPVLGALGGVGGNYLSQRRRILAGEQNEFRPGEMLSSALTGAIPGAPLEAAGARSMAREGTKQALAGVAGKTLETVVDEGRLPTGAEALVTSAVPAIGGAIGQRIQSNNPEIVRAVADAGTQDATRRATLAAGREAGYVIPPSTVNPGIVTNTLESIGGKAAIGQAAALRNQRVTNRLAKQQLGIPENQDITETVLRDIRQTASQPYAAIETMATQAQNDLDALLANTQHMNQHAAAAYLADPAIAQRVNELTIQASADIRALRDARHNANQKFRQYDRSADPAHLAEAQTSQHLAETLEQRIEDAATQFGTPELVDQLRAGRQRIAQTYDVERALNLGDANVSAPAIGKVLDKGKPLSGNLETIGEFAEAFPSAVREGSKVPTPGVSALQFGGSLAGGIGGYSAMGPAGALFALAPFARAPVRSLVLSEPYQNFATRIPLSVDARPDVRGLGVRSVAQEGSQEVAEEVKKHRDKAVDKEADKPKEEEAKKETPKEPAKKRKFKVTEVSP